MGTRGGRRVAKPAESHPAAGPDAAKRYLESRGWAGRAFDLVLALAGESARAAPATPAGLSSKKRRAVLRAVETIRAALPALEATASTIERKLRVPHRHQLQWITLRLESEDEKIRIGRKALADSRTRFAVVMLRQTIRFAQIQAEKSPDVPVRRLDPMELLAAAILFGAERRATSESRQAALVAAWNKRHARALRIARRLTVMEIERLSGRVPPPPDDPLSWMLRNRRSELAALMPRTDT